MTPQLPDHRQRPAPSTLIISLPLDAGANTDGRMDGCKQLLDGLTQPELEGLRAYARFRLLRVGLPGDLAEDVRQNALLAVLQGSRSHRRGRHPREVDLADPQAFTSYLKGIICSLVEARCRSHESRFSFVCMEPDLIKAGESGANERAATEDLAQQLFDRLRKRAPKHLRSTLKHWAAHWRECSVIPLAGKHRRYRQELRALAAKVFKEVSTPDLRRAQRTIIKSQRNHE